MTGPDGALWFTEYEGNLIGRLSARGCLVRGKTVGVERERGKVLLSLAPRGARMASAIRAAKGPRFEVERRARQIPVGSVVDVRRGSVILSSGRTANGNEVNSGVFGGGRFQVLQSRKRRLAGLHHAAPPGIERLRQMRHAQAELRARRIPVHSVRLRQHTVRRIRGRTPHGRFRTRGRHSALPRCAAPTWISVADRCDGTLTKVERGSVAVRDFHRKKTVILRAGQSYLARASNGP